MQNSFELQEQEKLKAVLMMLVFSEQNHEISFAVQYLL
jgi:hypothetical protein